MRRYVIITFLIAVASVARASDVTVENLVAEMNRYRAAEGLGPLFVDSRLMAAARDRMRDMEESGEWRHEPSDGGSPFAAVTRRGYEYSLAGENLATGYESAEILVESWMESPGHRENVMSPVFANVGIAIIDGHVARRAIGKSVVAIFGREMVKPVKRETRNAKRGTGR